MSDLISAFALVVAMASAVLSLRALRLQQKLTDQEVELIRRQLSSFERSERENRLADVSARLFQDSKNSWKIRVYNTGPASAHNVVLSSAGSSASWISETELSAIFPIRAMEKGHSVDVIAFIHLKSHRKEMVELSWESPLGMPKRKQLELNL